METDVKRLASKAIIREALGTVRAAREKAEEELSACESSALQLRAEIKTYRIDERNYLIALGEQPPPRKRKQTEPEKKRRGRPPKVKEEPKAEEAAAEEDKPLYPEGAEVACTRRDPPCGWYGKRSEAKGDRCPEENCRCFVRDIRKEERA